MFDTDGDGNADGLDSAIFVAGQFTVIEVEIFASEFGIINCPK